MLSVIYETKTAREDLIMAEDQLMVEYLNDLQERFFTWCDKAAQDHFDREGTTFKQKPRKNPDGSYDLVFKKPAPGKGTPSKLAVSIPEEFHELLEREYFCNHPPNEGKES
jgi:hypothetical protein